MMFRRDCVCGHMWAAHGWRWQHHPQCAACPCPAYQPPPRWRRRASRHIDQAIAAVTPRPPAGAGPTPGPTARTPARAPLPGPGHRHDRLDMTIQLWHDGCIHYLDHRGNLIEAWINGKPWHDYDAWLKGLTP